MSFLICLLTNKGISVSMSVRIIESRTSYMNLLESPQLSDSWGLLCSHQNSSKCHPWFASFQKATTLCV